MKKVVFVLVVFALLLLIAFLERSNAGVNNGRQEIRLTPPTSGSWVNATFLVADNWENYDPGEVTLPLAKYKIDSDGLVHVIGVIKNGNLGGAAFQLPEGLRPGKDIKFHTSGGGNGGGVSVDSDGFVTPLSPHVQAAVFLNAIIFFAEEGDA